MTKPRATPQAPWSRAKAARRVLTRDPAWAAAAIAKLRAACHPKQLDAADDPSLLVTVLTARGAGKSTGAMVRLFKTMARKRRARTVFIAVTKEHARDIIWEKVKSTFEKAGIDAVFNETKLVVTLVKNGSTLKLAGADDNKEIDKLRGMSFDGVVIDEASVHSPQLLEKLVDRVIGPRLGDRDGWIMMIGTPGHVLAGIFYDATRPGGPLHRPFADRERPEYAGWLGWSSHHWSLEEGARFVAAMAKLWARALATKQAKGWSDTHPVWQREYLGKWAADDTDNVFRYRPYLDDGAEWNVWDPERVGPFRIAKLPEGPDDWQHVIIFDTGFADEFAVNAFSFSPSNPKLGIWHRYCFEQVAFYARRFAELLLGEGLDTDSPDGLIGGLGEWPVAIVGDTNEAFLSELRNVYGITAVAVKKGRDYKFGAVELVNGDLVDRLIRILKGTPLEEQLLTLQWKVGEFGELTENKAQANHSSDCLIYGRKAIAHLFESGQVDESVKAKRQRAARRADPDEPPPESEWGDLLSSATYEDDDAWR